MSISSLEAGVVRLDGAPLDGGSSVRDFWLLMKPSVMQLAVFTGWVGLYLAPGHLHPVLALTVILCLAAGAGAAAAINNWFDADIDQEMTRTRLRPTANGAIAPADALALGVTLAVLSTAMMGLAINWLAATLLILTIAFYVFVYTLWLKRRTPQNIVIGGAAGALPPIIGWAAVTHDIALTPIVLFLLIFVWTPPHFWALALYRSADYAKVSVPMLPVVGGRLTTRRQIFAYTVALIPLSLVPCLTGELGLVYAASALLLGGLFVSLAAQLLRDDSNVTAMRTFKYSILYLFALFTMMVADRYLGLGSGF